jgi:hypothetical protein
MSMLDGFSGYNQIMVHPDDQEKTTFTHLGEHLCMLKCHLDP